MGTHACNALFLDYTACPLPTAACPLPLLSVSRGARLGSTTGRAGRLPDEQPFGRETFDNRLQSPAAGPVGLSEVRGGKHLVKAGDRGQRAGLQPGRERG